MLGLLFVNINNNGFSCEEGGEEFLFFIYLLYIIIIIQQQHNKRKNKKKEEQEEQKKGGRRDHQVGLRRKGEPTGKRLNSSLPQAINFPTLGQWHF